MKSVLISIRPKWCELIANGEKKIEVRKTRPKIPVPFKCYIYETKARSDMPTFVDEDGHVLYTGRGQVIGEFVCDCITGLRADNGIQVYYNGTKGTCLSDAEIIKYAGGKMVYYWHISDLKIYDKPKELGEFRIEDKAAIKMCEHRFRTGQPEDVARHGGWLQGGFICMKSGEPEWCENCLSKPLTRPPQSWCYAEEQTTERNGKA